MPCTRVAGLMSRGAFARAAAIAFGFACLVSGQAADAQDIAVSRKCGDATLAIQCAGGGGPHDCAATSLKRSATDGVTRSLPRPAEFSKPNDNTAAVGVACAVAKDGVAYFVVEYGQLPDSCPTCEWKVVIDRHGRALTRNDPPLITEPSLPVNMCTQPNNAAYGALVKKLGLKIGDFTYVRCTSDPAGSACMLQTPGTVSQSSLR